MQNLVVFMEPSENAPIVSMKGGNMIFNRFCIDEDAAFELSGIYYLKTPRKNILKKNKEKGKELSFLLYFNRFYMNTYVILMGPVQSGRSRVKLDGPKE